LSRTAPRSATAWTSTGTSHEHRGLKQRPEHAIRTVPVPPELVTLLTAHLAHFGTAADGRLFPACRGGLLSESSYGRAWHQARAHALGAAAAATGLARRPYDLRHAALSLWLSAGAPPAQIAARAGNSVAVLLSTYIHCIDGQEEMTNRHIGRALHTTNRACEVRASGPRHRRYRLNSVRYMSASNPRNAPQPARSPHCTPRTRTGTYPGQPEFSQSRRHLPAALGGSDTPRIWPAPGPHNTADGFRNRCFRGSEPLAQLSAQRSDLGFYVAGGGFEPT
jgi:hypothetical protein